MKLIAFIQGKPMPAVRVTQNVRFLFSKTVEEWQAVDDSNAKKAEQGLLNRKDKPYKATRYAYKLARLEKINSWRQDIYNTVFKSTDGNIPRNGMMFFFLIRVSPSWTKKKKKAHEWQPHENKPDIDNQLKLVYDALYKDDSMIHTTFATKLYVPQDYPEGVVILQDEKFMSSVVSEILEEFIKPSHNPTV